MNKSYIEVPSRNALSGSEKLLHYGKGALLAPLYKLLSQRLGTPGLEFHSAAARLGLHLLFRGGGAPSLGAVYGLVFAPLDSTRYFESDFVWRALEREPVRAYLDVSSPRLIPLLFLHTHRGVTARLINPDRSDFVTTERFLRALKLTGRAKLENLLLDELQAGEESFDVVTCVSVLEHIPESERALRRMWSLLKKGGRLVVTVPCMARQTEQFISESEYGILDKGADGYTFWQLYYDQSLLEQRIFGVVGRPAVMEVYGEKVAGSFARNAHAKRADAAYPFWREPYMMGTDYARFDSVAELPGEGVAAMEFVKR